jgi:hypothetical protein
MDLPHNSHLSSIFFFPRPSKRLSLVTIWLEEAESAPYQSAQEGMQWLLSNEWKGGFLAAMMVGAKD